tara:strand:+ start:1128 stop:1532 length:405 start_codon:yes stop_codon:yes gene_type:complete
MSKANYNQFYAPYWNWEDFNAGMYNDCSENLFKKMVKNSVSVLSDSEFFLKSALKMIESWQVSARVNLTNVNANRRAWIGQATCCYLYGCNEKSTRKAWSILTEAQRSEANKIADKLISHYEEQNRGVFKGLGI